MFNYLNELNGEIEKGEEAIAELKVEPRDVPLLSS